jgi:CRISPR-associated protein Cas5t
MVVTIVSKINVLKFNISLPSANFRVVQSNNPRRTYPLPPYSTVIGFLANIIGNQENINMMLAQPFALGIASKYECITREYTWLRNLNSKMHKKRFSSKDNRLWQGVPEHPGGQSPITIEVLNEVKVVIYLQHPKQEVEDILLENYNRPETWLSHLHLGRAEDWAIIDSTNKIELLLSNQPGTFKQAASYYQWLPSLEYAFGLEGLIKRNEYEELYKKIQGNAVLVTSFYERVELEEAVIRNFYHVSAHLCCSQIPFLDDFSLPSLLTDEELHLPVFLCHLDPTVKKEGISCG